MRRYSKQKELAPRDVVARAKAKPGDIAWGSAGMATMNHITGEQFASVAGIKILHVPYKGGSPAAANAAISGETQFSIVGLNSALPFVKTGRLKILAVLGNHEMYGDPLRVIRELEGSRIKLIVNDGVALGNLWIAGTSDRAAEQMSHELRLPMIRLIEGSGGGGSTGAIMPNPEVSTRKSWSSGRRFCGR